MGGESFCRYLRNCIALDHPIALLQANGRNQPGAADDDDLIPVVTGIGRLTVSAIRGPEDDCNAGGN